MSKLLSSNFSRIFKWSMFWATTVAMAAISAFYVIINKLSYKSLENLPFDILQFFPLIVAAVGGMFLSYEYKNNTIRNKIIVGYSRESVYLANYITIGTVSIIIYTTYMILIFIMGLTMLDTPNISVKAAVINSLMGILIIMTSVSIIVFICMLLKSAVSIVVALMINELFMIGTMFVQQFPNNSFCKVLDVILPTSILAKMNIFEISKNLEQSAVYMTVFCVVVTLLGIYLFKKSDLK